MIRLIASVSVLSLTGLAACAPTMAGGGASTEKVIYVAAETSPCTGVAPMTCLQVRDAPSAPWTLHYSSIEGFEHQPGVAYRLRVRMTPVANPPADAPSVRWSLVEILDQTPAR